MSWVLLSLRKKELKRAHADYVAEDLQISRAERQMSRRYQYEQSLTQNDMNEQTRNLRVDYTTKRDEISSLIEGLRRKSTEETKTTEEGEESSSKSTEVSEADQQAIANYQKELDDIKEQYQYDLNEAKTYWEDELAMIEEEANDMETMYEQDKVNAETQMEAISQEIQAVDQAISQEIQNNTIKLS